MMHVYHDGTVKVSYFAIGSQDVAGEGAQALSVSPRVGQLYSSGGQCYILPVLLWLEPVPGRPLLSEPPLSAPRRKEVGCDDVGALVVCASCL